MNRGLVLALALVCYLPRAAWAQSPQGPTPEVTVRLSNFAFTPKLLQLRVGVPVRLHLVNDSSGGHSFSAPAFFAASTYPSGASPRDGRVELAAHASADVTLVPRTGGTYKVECTHFLHSLFGMTGTIVVSGA
jgi:plastocyanin